MCYRAGVGNDRWSREAVAGVICMVVAPHCPLAEDAFSGAVLPADAQSGPSDFSAQGQCLGMFEANPLPAVVHGSDWTIFNLLFS